MCKLMKDNNFTFFYEIHKKKELGYNKKDQGPVTG